MLDEMGRFLPEDIERTKGLAWLSYLGFLFLVPLLVYKDSPYDKFHVNQGIVLFITEVIIGIDVYKRQGISLSADRFVGDRRADLGDFSFCPAGICFAFYQ